ncbi:hypothetical protein Q4524_11820 [Alteromonas stellipolaris]|uniref:Uncharacterized protein n=1 Tax=Alteromonas stellipolaris TaxID=233316 RepID=A0AAW7Z7R2_9ALTE|nr:hypothetical protein [Alteromonas stellipolaris]ANB20159.1 hypothetical protein A6K25_01980 [Alteromonas stellipolaris]MDO6539273.1 hypothetical protein [Alteromonas stellipolaris]MDO6579678.1 hypothetical protein [Alteromonas stellipolaris]
MEAKILIPLISGLIGAIIGALSSIITITIQQRSQSKRDKMKLASEMAENDRKFSLELAKEKGNAFSLPPVSVYQHFHYEILTALEKGNIKPEDLKNISKKNRELIEAIKSVQ